MDVLELFPQNDKDELFLAMDSKEYWLLLMVDLAPAGAIVNEVTKRLKTPLKSYSVKGLPPILVLPKNEFTTESLAQVMNAAAPGSLPIEMLEKALGGRDFILVSNPESIQLGLKAMDNFLSMHKEWKVERFGILLFTVTHRIYRDDYKEAIDFLLWMMVGIVCRSGAVRKERTDIEIAATIASTISEASSGGKEKAVRTVEALNKSMRFLEPALKVLDAITVEKTNQAKAHSVLNMWIKNDVDPNACAMWVASNIGLYLTFHEKANHEMIQDIADQLVQRIRKSLTSKRK